MHHSQGEYQRRTAKAMQPLKALIAIVTQHRDKDIPLSATAKHVMADHATLARKWFTLADRQDMIQELDSCMQSFN